MLTKPEICRACPMYGIGEGFVPPTGAGHVLAVGKAPDEDDISAGRALSGPKGSLLNNLLRSAGTSRDNVTTIDVISCRPPRDIWPTDYTFQQLSRSDAYGAIAYCAEHHLRPAIESRNWSKIITLGDEAMEALTPRKGSSVWRGSPLPLKWDNTRLRVIPTMDPLDLMKEFKMVNCVVADLKKGVNAVPENYDLYATRETLERFDSPIVSVDFEWDHENNITICGVSGRFYEAYVSDWKANVDIFKRIFHNATDLIGHNLIGAECKYFEQYGWPLRARMHDTMLKQHLIQPDMKHGLGFVASVFTNKMFWKGKGKEEEDTDGKTVEIKYQWRTWNTPEAIPRELGGYGGCTTDDEAYRLYNARDTEGAFQINTHLDALLDRWGLTSLYWNVAVPISYICRDISDAGLRINTALIGEIREELGSEVIQLERTLPDGLIPFERPCNRNVPAPPNTYKPKVFKCKGSKKAGTGHDTTLVTVHAPGRIEQCPDCGKEISSPKLVLVKQIKVPSTETIRPYASQKQVIAYARAHKLKVPMNRKRGTEAADKQAMSGWARTHPEFRIVHEIKENNTLINTFAKESMLKQSRLYFRLNPVGTSEGRFSSSGQRKGIDPNIQNQPPSIRKIYIPDDPEFRFVELDYSGGENWLTAWLAKDQKRLARLGTPGYNEHLDLARQLFDCPDLTKSEEDVREFWGQRLSGFRCYDIAKHANHGSNYGMTWVKLQEYLESVGIFFTAKQCKDVLGIRADMNPDTVRWQNETIEMAKRDGFLRNVFGRIRWFSSRFVSTESLAFLPASTLADIIIRAMIGHYPERFPNECVALGLTHVGTMEPNWRISAQIHDSLVLQGPGDLTQVHRSAIIMEQPWKELQGFALKVGVKVGEPGGSWGSLKTVTL